MAITSLGYAGSIDTTQWTSMSSRLGYRYAVHGANDCKVSPVQSATRTVRIAAGAISGGGVTDINDATVDVVLDEVLSGVQWFLVGARRTWQTTNATEFDFIAGTSSRALPTRPQTPGGEDFQPLALVQVTAGQTVPTDVVDLRCIASNSGTLIAYDDLVRSYMDEVGTVLRIGSTEWLRTANASGVASWVNKSSELLALIPTPSSSGGFGSSVSGWSTSATNTDSVMHRDGRFRTMFLEQKRTASSSITPSPTGHIANFQLFRINGGDRPTSLVTFAGLYYGGGVDYGFTGMIDPDGYVWVAHMAPNATLEGNRDAAGAWSTRLSASWYTA